VADPRIEGSDSTIPFKKETVMTPQVIVRSVAGAKFTQEIAAGNHQLIADEPESVGGSDRGPGPYEYLLTGLGT
jgi:uncharacterized OsmC-like protein